MITNQKRYLKGAALNGAAVAFSQGSTLIASILAARILLKQGFGEYAMAQSTLLTISTLAQVATGYTASKYVAEYRTCDPERAGRIMGLCASVSWGMAAASTLLLLVSAPFLADTLLGAPHLASALRLGSGYLFFSAINGYQIGALAGLEAYDRLAKAGAVSGLITVTAIGLGAWMGGLNGTLIGLSASGMARYAIHALWLSIACRAQGISPRLQGDWGRDRSVLFHFALPAALAGGFSLPITWLASSLLVRQPGGYGEMALYSSASSIRMMVMFVPQVLNNVAFSILNNSLGCGDNLGYSRTYRLNIATAFATTTLGSLAILLLGSLPLRVFGDEFVDGKPVLQILLISTLFESVAISAYNHLQSKGRIWISLFLINIPREIAYISLAFLLVPSMGSRGLGIAYTACWLLALMIIGSIVIFERKASVGASVHE